MIGGPSLNQCSVSALSGITSITLFWAVCTTVWTKISAAKRTNQLSVGGAPGSEPNIGAEGHPIGELAWRPEAGLRRDDTSNR